MEALVIEFAKKYGMKKAMEYFGLDQQSQNPKYAISLGNMTIDPMNMVKRAAFNTVGKTVMGGLPSLGSMGLIGGSLFLGRMFDATRPGSRNYNPNLAGQIARLKSQGMLSNTGKILSGPLAGKNLVSMFGTNDYDKMLDKQVDYFEDRISKGKPISEDRYREAKNEQIESKGIGVNIDGVTMSGADYQGEVDNTGASTKGGNKGGSKSGGHSGSGYQGASGSHHYRRGGIASL